MLESFSQRRSFSQIRVMLGLVGSLVVVVSFFLGPIYRTGFPTDQMPQSGWQTFLNFLTLSFYIDSGTREMIVVLFLTGALITFLICSSWAGQPVERFWPFVFGILAWLGLAMLTFYLYGHSVREMVSMLPPTAVLVAFLIGCAWLAQPVERLWLRVFCSFAWLELVIFMSLSFFGGIDAGGLVITLLPTGVLAAFLIRSAVPTHRILRLVLYGFCLFLWLAMALLTLHSYGEGIAVIVLVAFPASVLATFFIRSTLTQPVGRLLLYTFCIFACLAMGILLLSFSRGPAGIIILMLLPTVLLATFLIGSAIFTGPGARRGLRVLCIFAWLDLIIFILTLYGPIGAEEIILLLLPTGALATLFIGCAGLARPLERFWLRVFGTFAWLGMGILLLSLYGLVFARPEWGYFGMVAGYVCMLIERRALSKAVTDFF
jgi:hypothetical protein